MTVIKYFYIEANNDFQKYFLLPASKNPKKKKNQINKAKKISLDNFYPKSYRSHRI